MKYLYSSIIFLSAAFTSWGQQKNYFPYQYNKTYGLTNNDGSKIIEDQFTDFSDYDDIEDRAIFEKNDDKYVIYNLIDGSKKTYQNFKPNFIYLVDEYFSLVKLGNKYQLIGQTSSKPLALPKDIDKDYSPNLSFFNKDYVIFEQRITQFPTDKSGKVQMPISTDYYMVYKNNKSLPFVTKIKKNKGDVMDYNPIRKIPKSQDPNADMVSLDDSKYIRALKPWHFYYMDTFDIAIIQNYDKKNIRVYDNNFKLIKATPYDRSNENLNDVAKKIMEAKYPNYNIQIKSTITAVPVSGFSSNKKDLFWKIDTINNQYVVSYLKGEDYIKLCTSESKVEISRDNFIKFTSSQNGFLKFEIYRGNPELHYPKIYDAEFGITK